MIRTITKLGFLSIVGLLAYLFYVDPQHATERLAGFLAAAKQQISAEKLPELAGTAKAALSAQVEGVANTAPQQEKWVKIYKWKDAQGVLHFDNHPVAGAQEILVDSKINTIPSAETQSPQTQAAQPPSSSEPKTMNEEVNKMREARQQYIEQMNGI